MTNLEPNYDFVQHHVEARLCKRRGGEGYAAPKEGITVVIVRPDNVIGGIVV